MGSKGFLLILGLVLILMWMHYYKDTFQVATMLSKQLLLICCITQAHKGTC